MMTHHGKNHPELSIQGYKNILGNKLHAREMSRQKNEAMIGYGILIKITALGIPVSYRYACRVEKSDERLGNKATRESNSHE